MQEMRNILNDWITKKGQLPNSNYKFLVPSNMSNLQAESIISSNNIDTLDLFNKIAAFIEIDGAFNINSTSKESWVAQLSALRDKSVLYDDEDIGDYKIDSSNVGLTPVLSQTIPTNQSLDSKGGQTSQIIDDSWSHYRSLDDSQISKLAEEIVKQIKIRGPFYPYLSSLTEKYQKDFHLIKREQSRLQLTIHL